MRLHGQFPFRIPWLFALVIAAGLLSLVAALLGLFLPGGAGVTTVTTWRGESVELYGQGVYRDFTLFHGAGAKGTDTVTILGALPLLVAGLALARRGSMRGMLLILGGLTWITYVYVRLALGATYTSLFLLYVATFGVGLSALIGLLLSVDLAALRLRLGPGVPRRGVGRFLIASGIVTAIIWLIEPVAALISGDPPASLDTASTLFTYGVDLAIIAPAAIFAGVLVLRGRAVGYLTGMPLLVLEALLAPLIIAQTIFQLDAGVDLTVAGALGPIAGFMMLAVVATWMIVQVLRHIDDGEADLAHGPGSRGTPVTPPYQAAD